jgi:hypothetical protein
MNHLLKNIFYTIFLLLLFAFSCKSSSTIPSTINTLKNHSSLTHTSIPELTIKTNNLSEDMSSISSKNDEIQIFIFDYSDTSSLRPSIFHQAILFDSTHLNYTFNNFIQKPYPTQVILFLMEEDSGRKTEEMESPLRKNFKEMIAVWNNHELVKLEQYLGDDDILGYKIFRQFNSDSTKQILIDGVLRADRYSYFIQLNY